MKPLFLFPVLVSLPGIARAECGPARQTVFSCSLDSGEGYLDICLSDGAVTLESGRVGAGSDLSFIVPIAEIANTPWPGISSFGACCTKSNSPDRANAPAAQARPRPVG